MELTYSKSIMASYATFKELYNSKKYQSPYQILWEFIKFIIASHSLHSVTSTDIQMLLNEEFGFNLPLAVIRKAMSKKSEISRNNNTYQVIAIKENTAFLEYRQQSESNSVILTNSLLQYADNKGISNLNKNMLAQEFIAFVLDEEGSAPYQQLIGEFILDNETNSSIKGTISTIREGSILFSGLVFNISEFGSLTQPITLYLDTEILFDIVGLNGILFKTLADDFLNLVDIANRGERIISLRFFSKVKDEIDKFYAIAEKIISGYLETNFSQAMKNIVDGCQSISDVSDKKVDLFRILNDKGIYNDNKKNYYTDFDNNYNLEGMNLPEYPVCEENIEGYLFCSHINKLRKGHQTSDCLSSKYLCITDTRRVLGISKAITESMKNPKTGEKFCDYAVSLSHITNLLWYKLNRGFGSNVFPYNLDVVIKARIILSSYITQNITLAYKDIKTKAANGDLTQEQVATRIVNLREKATLPEELDPKNIEETLDFSEEYFSQFEETIAQNRRLLSEQDKTIRELYDNIDDLKYQLTNAVAQDTDKQNLIDQLTNRIKAFEDQEKAKGKKKRRRKALLKLFFSIFKFISVVVILLFFCWLIVKCFNTDFATVLSIGVGVLGVLPFSVKKWRIIWKQYLDEIH